MAKSAERGEAKKKRRSVEELLLPETPENIRNNYLQLAERAKSARFGLLEDDIVVLDTETTGLSFKSCELIEIAAARISDGKVAERFHSFVKPSGPIPEAIVALTGICDEDVADAPSAVAAVAALADFVGGMPVVAHNADFDRTFVESVAGGHEVSDTWIDSLALSRIALPMLSTHRLADMAEVFGCDSVSHRAVDDIDALAGVWRVILCGLADLPAGLLGMLADMHEDVDWSFRPIFSHLALENPHSGFSLESIRKELADAQARTQRNDAMEYSAPLQLPQNEELVEEFAHGGTVDRMYANYETRPEQTLMSTSVLDALRTSTHLAVEAGTGVGKSIAYLLPLIRAAQENHITCGIATKTNALTDQLVTHELPDLARVLPDGLSFFTLKGYDHYPCLRRILRAMDAELPEAPTRRGRESGRAEAEMLTAIATTLAFACQAPSGDLDALGIRWGSVPRELITTTSDRCERGRCPFFPNGCLVHGSRRRAAGADVVVTNHSLLLRNVEADGKILPPIRHWVVDEAHSFEQEARRQWAREASAEFSKRCFETLGGVRSGAIHAMLSQVATTEASTLLMGLLTKCASQVSRASLACGDFFDAVRGLAPLGGDNSGYDNLSIWIDEGVRLTPEWAALSEAGVHATDVLDQAIKALDEANEALAGALDEPGGDLLDATRQLKELYDAIALTLSGNDMSYVYSAQLTRGTRGVGSEKLVAEKLDIGEELAQRWYPETKSVIFTSATMAVGEDFSHFTHAVGLDRLPRESYNTIRLDSSYDFDEAMGVALTPDLPDPNNPDYLEALEELLYDIHVGMEGSVLTLFTNRREMERVYEGLAPRLSQQGLELMMQERNSSARQIRERFLAEKQLSLLALRSFWEGFDAGGDTLRCVVIPKLPFASPRDPLVRERDQREERAWWRYSLPEAVLSVKQAAGRLIRMASDRGILVLADSRLFSKRYGRTFVASLPSHSVREVPVEEMTDYIRSWRRLHDC